MEDSSSKIDTQGMGGPVDPNYKSSGKPQEHKPATITPRRLFTPQMVKELKILINEVLDEREHKKRMEGAYDNVKPFNLELNSFIQPHPHTRSHKTNVRTRCEPCPKTTDIRNE